MTHFIAAKLYSFPEKPIDKLVYINSRFVTFIIPHSSFTFREGPEPWEERRIESPMGCLVYYGDGEQSVVHLGMSAEFFMDLMKEAGQ